MRKSDRFPLSLLTALLLAVVSFAAFWERQSPPDAVDTLPARSSSPATLSASPDSALRGKLYITELMVKNRAALADEDGDFPDWIELANLSDETLTLTGCRIADREGRAGWPIPETRLAPGERLVLFASKKNRTGETLHTDFALSEKDCVWLVDGKGRTVDSVRCADCEADVALALTAAGDWQQSLYPTPGEENSAAGYDRLQAALRAPGPLVISEAAARNLGLNVAGTADDCDWVEIKNISGEPVLLSDYFLSDKVDRPFLWRLPEETLSPGAAVLFVCADEGDGFFGTTPCTGFSLNAAHEQLYLTRADGTRSDYASLRDIPAGGSFGRMDGEAGFFYFAVPSPGRDNRDGCRRVSAMPQALSPDGVFEGVKHVTLTLSGPEGAVLRYTVNGSAPTEASEAYTGPIEITETCVVSVKSFEPGALPSRSLALTFLLNEGHSLPVLSFTAEDMEEFSNIYGAGVKLHELPGTLALYREGDSFRINCGVRLNGETSLILPKKNMAVRFNGAYGAPTLEHDIFGGGVTSFSHLLLRAGQDQYQGVIRNELAQSLAEKADTAVINQRSIFCVLYLNGQYAGLYTLKERPNAALYAAAAGVEEDSVECVEAPAPYGSELYEQTLGFVNSHDMSLDESYRQLCTALDIDSLIDWLILEGFCANTDVTSGNLRYARSPQADGRWHLLFYDLDAAFRSFDSIQSNLLNDYGASSIQVAAFAVPLMKNAAFRDRFLSRAAALLRGPLSNEAVLTEIRRMADEIRPEIPRDYARVGGDARSWENALAELESMVADKDWRQANIEGLCRAFELDSAERAAYFGDMDSRAEEGGARTDES